MKRGFVVWVLLFVMAASAHAGVLSFMKAKKSDSAASAAQMQIQINPQNFKAVTEEDLMAEEIERRQIEIKKIHDGLVVVNGQFNELQTLVKRQGEMIDRIVLNIESAREHVKGGLGQIQDACNLQ